MGVVELKLLNRLNISQIFTRPEVLPYARARQGNEIGSLCSILLDPGHVPYLDCSASWIPLDTIHCRWVSVVEFHDGALGIGKVFGQGSTVVKWNYQILALHQVTVRQKLGVILVIKWFKNWSQQKMLFTKKVHLNWYSSMNFFLERFRWFLT